MSKLTVLCSPLWISISASDPFLVAFQLSEVQKEAGRVNGSFENDFEELYEKTEQFCVQLIDNVKYEHEVTFFFIFMRICVYRSQCK